MGRVEKVARARRVLAIISTAAAVLMVPGVASAADWSQFHGPVERTGVTTETVLTKASVPGLHIVWSRATGVTAEGINSSPAIVGGVAYIGSDDGKVWAFDATTGAVKWSFTTGGQVRSAPAVVGTSVFVGSADGNMYALDAATGASKWTKYLGGNITAAPLVVNGIVYIGSRGGRFYALDSLTGAQLWSYNTWAVWASAAYSGGTVYVGSDQSALFAFDAVTGVLKWKSPTSGRERSAPSVSGGRVFTGSDSGRVYAFNALTGVQIWSAAAADPSTGPIVRSSPTIAGSKVVVTTGETTPMDGHVVAFDVATGTKLWTTKLADYSTSSAAFANGVLYLGSFDTRLYAISAQTGVTLWTSGWGTLPRGLNSSPAIANGKVYVGVRDGGLYAFGL